MGEDALDGDEALGLGNFHPDAGVPAVGLSIEGRELLGRQQDAVGIIELVHQAARSLFVESRRIDGVHETRGYDAQHLVEQPSTLLALLLLKDEASDHQRNQCEAEEQTFSGS